MNNEKQQVTHRGLVFGHLLTILFIGLKLTGYIDWSWWLVLLPMYARIGVILAIIIALLVFHGVKWMVQPLFDKGDRK